MKGAGSGAFRSLRSFNYRLWAGGALISNVGAWMQRTAQDWLVLTELTDHNATAVGLVIGLQFGPQLLLLPWTGFAADHFDRRKLLIATQAAQAALALALGLLAVAGFIRLWQVDVLAFLFGCVTALDAPARQTFVSDMVSDDDLPNAVALNSASFNAAQMIGPAVAGVVIAAVGSGWAFLINAASFVAVLCSLGFLRLGELRRSEKAPWRPGGFAEGFRYVWRRPDLRSILVMLFLIGTFGLNFPIFISTMSVAVFHGGPSQYGLLTSALAFGTMSGALLAAARERTRFVVLLVGAAVLALGFSLAAISPTVWLFAGALVVVGVSALTFTNATNTLMQLSTEPAMRGRVMALRLAVGLGGAPLGGPAVGWVADAFGPRWALGVAAVAGVAAAAVALTHLAARRRLHMRVDETASSVQPGR